MEHVTLVELSVCEALSMAYLIHTEVQRYKNIAKWRSLSKTENHGQF